MKKKFFLIWTVEKNKNKNQLKEKVLLPVILVLNLKLDVASIKSNQILIIRIRNKKKYLEYYFFNILITTIYF